MDQWIFTNWTSCYKLTNWTLGFCHLILIRENLSASFQFLPLLPFLSTYSVEIYDYILKTRVDLSVHTCKQRITAVLCGALCRGGAPRVLAALTNRRYLYAQSAYTRKYVSICVSICYYAYACLVLTDFTAEYTIRLIVDIHRRITTTNFVAIITAPACHFLIRGDARSSKTVKR